MHTYDMVIIGGGIVGLSAAIAMKQLNFEVAVISASHFDLSSSEQWDSRVYAINHASEQFLASIDVWQKLNPSRITPYHHMHIWDHGSPHALAFDSRMIARDRLGTIIEEKIIKDALIEKAVDLEIPLYANSEIKTIEELKDHIIIATADSRWQAQLLMVADGAHSFAREALKVPLEQWSYKQDAIVCNVETETAHQNTAFQRFLKQGPLAFLPLSKPHHCSIVWTVEPLRAKELLAMPKEAFEQVLSQAFQEKLGAVSLLGPRFSFPLTMRHVKKYCGQRWMLLGDCAHTIHPMAGLGLNLGLADVTQWRSLVIKNKKRFTSPQILNAYQRQRKAEVWQMILLLQGLKALFANALLALPRGLGMAFINQNNVLKRLCIKVAG